MNVLKPPLGCRGRFAGSQLCQREHWLDEKHYPILQDLHLTFLLPYLAQNSACSFSVECTPSLHPDVSLQIINRPPSCFANGQLFETLTNNIAVYHVVFAPCEQICRGKPDSNFSPNFIFQHFLVNSKIKSELK